MEKKVKIPKDRAKAYEMLLGKQRGDNVVIKNKSVDKRNLPKPIHTTLTTMFGVLKVAIVAFTLIFAIIYSICNCLDMFNGYVLHNGWSESFSLYKKFVLSEIQIIVPALIGCAILLACVFFVEFIYYLVLYIVLSIKDSNLEKSNEEIIDAIKNTLDEQNVSSEANAGKKVEFNETEK